MTKKQKHLISGLVPWVLLIVAFMVLIISGEIKQVFEALRIIKPIFLVASLVLILAYWTFEATILHLLLNRVNEKLSFKRSLMITMAGQFFNGITPFASGGQPAQLYLLHKNKVALGKGASVLTKKFIAYQAALVLYGLVVLIFESRFFTDQISNFIYLGAIGFLVNFLVIIGLVMMALNYKMTKKIIISMSLTLRKRFDYLKVNRKTVKILRQVNIFHQQMMENDQKKNVLFFSFILSLLQLTFYFSIPVMIGFGFELTFVSLYYVIGAAAFVAMVTSFVPLPGAALGAEGSFYIVFQIFFPSNIIVTTLLLWRIITFYLPIAVGGMVVLTTRKHQIIND